jgi:hypothetical protein
MPKRYEVKLTGELAITMSRIRYHDADIMVE